MEYRAKKKNSNKWLKFPFNVFSTTIFVRRDPSNNLLVMNVEGKETDFDLDSLETLNKYGATKYIDNLTTSSISKGLSANMGRELNDSKAPLVHNHDADYYKKLELDNKLKTKAEKVHNHDADYYKKPELDTKLNAKAEKVHNHDTDYYKKLELDTKLNTKAEKVHNHDTDYYKKLELDTKLNAKAEKDHNHDADYYKKLELDNKLKTKAEKVHNHDADYYKKPELDTKLNAKAEKVHNHDADYYKKPELDTKLNTKAEKVHNHNADYYKKLELDTKLNTKAEKVHNHNADYYKKLELDTKLNAKAEKVHNHDVDYYKKLELDNKLKTKADLLYTDGAGNKINAHTQLEANKNTLTNNSYRIINNADDINNNRVRINTNEEFITKQGKTIKENKGRLDNHKAILDNKADKNHTHDNLYHLKNTIDSRPRLVYSAYCYFRGLYDNGTVGITELYNGAKLIPTYRVIDLDWKVDNKPFYFFDNYYHMELVTRSDNIVGDRFIYYSFKDVKSLLQKSNVAYALEFNDPSFIKKIKFVSLTPQGDSQPRYLVNCIDVNFNNSYIKRLGWFFSDVINNRKYFLGSVLISIYA